MSFFSDRCHFIVSFPAWTKPIQIFSNFLFYSVKLCVFHKFKYRAVMWLFKIEKFMCISFSCSCVQTFSYLIAWCTLTWNPKVHQLHEFAICTSSQGGNERWQLISKFIQFNCVNFPDLNPNSHDNLSNMIYS